MLSRVFRLLTIVFLPIGLSVLALIFFSLHPAIVKAAANNIGTHLAQFDDNAQVGVLNMIKSKVGSPNGYPVTLMVDITWAGADDGRIAKIAAVAEGFSVAVRITGFQATTSQDDVKALAQKLNSVTWNTSGKPAVVLGNELDNVDPNREWGGATPSTQADAGKIYAILHQAFRAALDSNKYDLAASPPGTPDWKKFTNAARVGSYSAYGAANNSVFALNIYGDASYLGEGGAEGARSAVGGSSSRTIYTEYGPQNPKAPIKDYLSYVEANAPPSGVEFANVLLPDCNGEANFGKYFWVRGKVFDIFGSPIDPETCKKTGEGSQFFDESSQIDPEVQGAYVYKGILDDVKKNGGGDRGIVAGLSRAARYIMTCAPQFWIGAQVDDQTKPFYLDDKMKQYYSDAADDFMLTLAEYCEGPAVNTSSGLNTNEPNCMFDPIKANFWVMNSQLEVPLYRRVKVASDGAKIYDSNRAESFDSFFGVNTKYGRITGDPIFQSPNRKVLSEDAYCAQTVNYLKAIDVLCKEQQADAVSKEGGEAKPLGSTGIDGRCALNNVFKDRDGVEHDYIEVLKSAKGYSTSKTGELDPVSYCSIPKADRDKTIDSLLSEVQPLTKNAFKIGYLVYYNTGRYKRNENKSLEEQIEDDGTSPAFNKQSRQFHPIYRWFNEYYGDITFDIIPFLVPANVFSSPKDEEILVNPYASDSYKEKMDASFSSPYLEVFGAYMPKGRIEQIYSQEADRKSAIGSAQDFGMTYTGKVKPGVNMWNGLNIDEGNIKRFIDCPYCDPSFPTPSGVKMRDRDYYADFASVIWHRINAGIYAKEFTEKLQAASGFSFSTENPQGSQQDGDSLVATPSDEWSTCNIFPEVVRGETATALTSSGSHPLWGKVKDGLARLEAIVRAPQGKREDKYNYFVRGFLLLPEEYGTLMTTEKDFLSMFLSRSEQEKLFVDEQQRNDFGKFAGISGLSPTDPNYDSEVPKYNRFLRLNGQVIQLEDLTLGTSGLHGKEGDPSWYYTESKADYEAAMKKYFDECAESGTLDCAPFRDRKSMTITAKFNSWNKGANENLADFRPLLPGGWLARGIFEVMAHFLAAPGTQNYQAAYCGLEDYLIGGSCAAAGGQKLSLTSGGIGAVNLGITCMNVWVDAATAQQHADDLLARLPTQTDMWDRYYEGYLDENPIRQCKNAADNPDPSEYGSVAKQLIFETLPECGGKPCYQFIIEQALSKTTSDGKVVDPYIALSIAFNENGGLKTARIDRMSQHFGVVTPRIGRKKECPEDNEYIGTIPEKLDIMLNTLLGDYKGAETLGKDGVAALEEYKLGSNAKPEIDQTYSQTMIQKTELLSGSSDYSPQCGI
ncbi:MAG TPA: hypothetical protein VJ246_03805 [Patescibacteria group bacterium]|nr:hypothetical protein [Patescibacteria group bacterium]